MNTKYLVAISNTNGNNEILRRISGYLRELLERYNKPLNDCVLLYLGDALPIEKMQEKDIPEHYEKLTQALSNAELPVIGVGGSLDIEDAMREAFEKKGWHFLHGETVEWNGLNFAGYGGSKLKSAIAEEQLGLPQEKFVQFSDEDLVSRLSGAEIDIFLHHTMPYDFVDIIGYRELITNRGIKKEPVHIGSKGMARILSETRPALDICGHIPQSTASKTENRTVFIKCHGFEPRYGFPVYYVEIAYDQDGIPYVKSNVDISFQIGEDSAQLKPRGLVFDPKAFALLTPRPIVTCREEYECTTEEMVHHYRIQKSREREVIVKYIKTPKGFKPIGKKPAVTGADDISWAFAGDEERDQGKSRIITEP